MTKQGKIQNLLITHLLDNGQITLLLPDGIKLEIGITQEDKYGDMVKVEDYCWVIATSHDERDVSIDSYNMGLRFQDDNKKIIYEDVTFTDDGVPMRMLNVV